MGAVWTKGPDHEFQRRLFPFSHLQTIPMAILEAPPEILVEILSEVPSLLDLLVLGGVCKDFHQAFKDSVRLQYRVELEKSGMVNNSFCTLPTPTRLEMLCEREHAWRHLNWKFIAKNITVPLKPSPPGQTSGFQSISLSSVDRKG